MVIANKIADIKKIKNARGVTLKSIVMSSCPNILFRNDDILLFSATDQKVIKYENRSDEENGVNSERLVHIEWAIA